MKADAQTLKQLKFVSPAKRSEPWTARPAQRQVLANALYSRATSTAQRRRISDEMTGRPLDELPLVVASVLEEVP